MSQLALKLIKENKELYKTDPEKARFLDLGKCGLTELPKELFECVWLEKLILCDAYWDRDSGYSIISKNLGNKNKLTKLNDDFRLLQNLKALLIGGNWGENWPISNIDSLGYLNSLEFLYLHSNSIFDLSPIKNLTNLKYLNLNNNTIEDITPLKYLKLTEIGLSGNKIKKIDVFGELRTIIKLSINDNPITNIKPLGYLSKLESLVINSNKVSYLNILEKLVNLNSLRILSNEISDIRFLENLTNLNSLDISNNHIKDIRHLEKLTNLTSLDISNNQISDIRHLEKLTNLTSLDIRNNQISDIRHLEKLTNLNSLNLSSNLISDIRFLEKLTKLNSLDLSSNQISDTRHLEKLINLTSLSLNSNQIRDIRYLEKLTDLNSLELLENQISNIKPLLPFFRKGLEISMQEFSSPGTVSIGVNPITDPPIEIVNQGREAILRHFERLEKEEKDFIYEAKLTLVGEGGSGKTSLQRKIKNEQAALPTGDERTRGIEVIDWEFIDKEGNNYTTHIWDFGGQDVYYPVHRFFLTDNAVYVLMSSTRFSVHNFEYWIPTIYQFGGKSPIVLVQNCDKGSQKPWDDVNVF